MLVVLKFRQVCGEIRCVCVPKRVQVRDVNQPPREGITDRSPGKPWLVLSPLSPGACVTPIDILTRPVVKGPFPTCRLVLFGEQVETSAAAAVAAAKSLEAYRFARRRLQWTHEGGDWISRA